MICTKFEYQNINILPQNYFMSICYEYVWICLCIYDLIGILHMKVIHGLPFCILVYTLFGLHFIGYTYMLFRMGSPYPVIIFIIVISY